MIEGNEENGTPRFASAVRGYDRMQVDDYIERLHQWIEQADNRAQQCETAAARANAEAEQLRRRLASVDAGTLAATPESMKALGDRVGKIMKASLQNAEEVRRRAEDVARATTVAAEEAATRVVEQATARSEELSRTAEELFVQAQEALAGAGAAVDAQVDNARAAATAERQELVQRARAEAREMAERTHAEETARREHLSALEEQRCRVMEEIALLRERLGNIGEGLALPEARPRHGGDKQAALPASSDDRPQDETMVLERPVSERPSGKPTEQPTRRRVASSAR
jgi:cell division septum initiation protein DivIVA